jgi:uncharacterized protein (TIGR03437 family)
MKAIIGFCALALSLGTMAQAATISTTLTVSATGALSATAVTATGTATMPNVFSGNGTFSGTLPIAGFGGSNVIGTFTITLSGGTLAGTLTLPVALLTGLLGGTTTTGTGSATITGGTGTYSGYTGSFQAVSGSGAATSATAFTLTLTGAGTINTTGGTTTTPTPAITAVQNNYSYILPGLPNFGIAPGALFIIKGSNLNSQPLSSLQSSAAPGVPLTLNGTSISVTVNGTTTQPAIYYSSPSQLGAVLPSTTPVGTGTITVTNSGQASAPAPILVVQSALGLDTLYGTGTGQGVASDPNFNFLGPTNSASPGEVINLWGSGVGADTANDDRTYPLKEDNLTNIPMQVYIGGIPAAITYRGRSQFPGVDQVQVTIPTGVPTGCFVGVVAVSGNIVSNSVTIPVGVAGAPCTDPNIGISSSTSSTLSGKTSVNFGYLSLSQSTAPGTGASAAPVTSSLALAEFQNQTGAAFGSSSGGSAASIGSCIVTAPMVLAAGILPTITGLDAGTITVNGPGGSQTLNAVPTTAFYEASLPTGYIPAAGGSFTFNGTGGATVGQFSTTLNFPSPLVWTNMSSVSTISRSQGVPVTWTGGGAGSYVVIGGGSTATVGGQQVTVSFTCAAPASAGQFTVPSYILLALPAGSGTLAVDNYSNPQTFTATGLDIGYQFAGSSVSINATYN